MFHPRRNPPSTGKLTIGREIEMKEYAYIDTERMEEALRRQMDVYRSGDTDDVSYTDDDKSMFPPRIFPDRDGEPVVRRRSRAHIQHLIDINEY